MNRIYKVFIWFLLFFLLSITNVWAQLDRYNYSWYLKGEVWIKISVNTTNIYRVKIDDLIPHGFDTTLAKPSNVHMYEMGREIPIEVISASEERFDHGDEIRWFGKKLDGKEELWAYRLRDPSIQSSDINSLYTDTVHYWLTWHNDPPLRYSNSAATPTTEFFEGFRDTTHLEEDLTNFYEGYDELAEMSTYTESEGLYWKTYNLTNVAQVNDPIAKQTLPDLLWRTDSLIHITARFHALSSNRVSANKRVALQVFRDLEDGSGTDFSNLAFEEWSTQRPRTISGSLPGYVLVDTTTLELRIQLTNISQIQTGVNLVNLDWVRYSFYRGFKMQIDLPQVLMYLRAEGQKSVRLTNLAGATSVRVYVPHQRKIITAVVENGNTAAEFFNDTPISQPTAHIMVKNDIYANPLKIKQSSVRQDLLSADNEAEYIVLTRPRFADEANAYAQYRAQANGLSTKVILMDDVWELFDYGLRRPIALRRFLIHASREWKVRPRYLFIIGDASDPYYNQPIRSFEVPSFGIPSSDDWYSMNFGGDSDWRPALATGRLTVRTNDEIRQYRNKVRNYERQLSINLWQKRIALLSGGNTNSERAALSSFNRSFGNLAESSEFGADTVYVVKTSNDPLGQAPRRNLKEILDDGVLILHFFGHSAPNSWDLLTDDPRDFNNVNRGSVVLSLGCYSGRFASSEERIISENFVYAENASVAYVGGAGAGQIPALNRYGNTFYDTIFNRGTSILGDVVQQTKTIISTTQGQVFMDIALLQNSILLGDPGLKLALPNQPDYLFPGQALEIAPNPTTVVDSVMNVSIDIVNWGKRAQDVVELKVIHTKPSREIESYFATIPNFSISHTQNFPLPLNNESAGIHEFQFVLDEDRSINEFSTANNSYFSSHIVFSTGVDIISPLGFSKVSPENVDFVVSSPTIQNLEFVQFEIDTTNTFFNPILRQTIASEDVTIIWKPEISFEDNQKYYWRVRVVESAAGITGITSWKSAVFTVDASLEGNVWFQDSELYPQNAFSITLKQSQNGDFEFDTVELPVSTATSDYRYGADNSGFTASTRVNGVEYGRRIISFHVIALDGGRGSIKLDKQYTLHPGQYGVGNVNQLAASNEFRTDISSLREGDFVIARVRHVSQIFPSRTLFVDSRILSTFNSIGGFKAGSGVNGTQTSQLDTNAGYILFGKKGAAEGESSEYIVRTNGTLEADTVFTFNSPAGSMNSMIVGPAKSWGALSYSAEISTFSGLSIDVLGLDEIGGRAVPLKSSSLFRAGVNTLNLSDISVKKYPYLQLRANLVDSTRRSTPQMSFWSVDFEPAPELTINPFSLTVPRDTVEEGFDFSFNFEVQNIGVSKADTVEIIMSDRIEGEAFRIIARDTAFNVNVGERRQIQTQYTTLGLKGKHELLVEIRPTTRDLYEYNNFVSYEYFVDQDKNPPLAEVMIENQYFPPQDEIITDKNDPTLLHVRENPLIEVRWRDANPFLRLDSPDLIEIDLNGTIYRQDNPEMIFTAATENGRNEARVIFRPTIEVSSDSLFNMIVYAKDKTFNVSESSGYILNFKVTNVTSIKSFYPYPNPMTNFTFFAFEFTGNDIANLERLRVTVYTLNGRPVKYFDLLNQDAYLIEGGLRIGFNKFYWDGRDQDGKTIANGVYLYHVDAKATGEQLTVNNEKSIEKLVIIR